MKSFACSRDWAVNANSQSLANCFACLHCLFWIYTTYVCTRVSVFVRSARRCKPTTWNVVCDSRRSNRLQPVRMSSAYAHETDDKIKMRPHILICSSTLFCDEETCDHSKFVKNTECDPDMRNDNRIYRYRSASASASLLAVQKNSVARPWSYTHVHTFKFELFRKKDMPA